MTLLALRRRVLAPSVPWALVAVMVGCLAVGWAAGVATHEAQVRAVAAAAPSGMVCLPHGVIYE